MRTEKSDLKGRWDRKEAELQSHVRILTVFTLRQAAYEAYDPLDICILLLVSGRCLKLGVGNLLRLNKAGTKEDTNVSRSVMAKAPQLPFPDKYPRVPSAPHRFCRQCQLWPKRCGHGCPWQVQAHATLSILVAFYANRPSRWIWHATCSSRMSSSTWRKR